MGEVRTLLLAEDEAIIGMAESKELEAEGYEVILVPDGETAIETVGSERDIDLVLMDINLGEGMDGTEAARRILSRHGYVPDFRAQFRKKDGSILMGLMSATRVKIGGEPCVLAITKDLSLLESLDAGLREIADSVPALIAMADAADLTYVFVNANYEKAFGMTRDRIIGTTVRKLLGEESFALALPYLEAARSGRKITYDIFFEVVGGKRLFNVNYKPLFGAAGKVDRIVILNIDIIDKPRRS